jgi:uncharacterized repeat protein (TIGR01451 family)
VPTAAGTYTFTTTITNSTGGSTTTQCTITIQPSPITVACAGSSGQIGVTFNSSLHASGGVAPYTYSITVGALPSGLTLNASTGAITGTPITAGTFAFTAMAKDSSGTTAGTVTSNCTITIASSVPGIAIVKTANPTVAAPGQSVTYTYVVTNTGNVNLNNITVNDDNGTPYKVSDDFTVGTIAALAPGVAATLTATTIPSQTSTLATLGAAGPSSGFAVLSLGGDSAHPNSGINCSAATVTGNIGVASYGKFTSSAPCVFNGDIYKGTNVTYSNGGVLNGSLITNETLLNSLRAKAFYASSYFSGLPVTAAVQSQFPANGNIASALTITGTPGINVVNLTAFTLAANLTFTGPAGTQFVININGNVNFHSGTVSVAGGVGNLDVTWNATNPNATFVSAKAANSVGVVLAPNYGGTSMADWNSQTGQLIGGYNDVITLMSSTVLKLPPTPPPTVTNTATASVTVGGTTISATTTATVTIQ